MDWTKSLIHDSLGDYVKVRNEEIKDKPIPSEPLSKEDRDEFDNFNNKMKG